MKITAGLLIIGLLTFPHPRQLLQPRSQWSWFQTCPPPSRFLARLRGLVVAPGWNTLAPGPGSVRGSEQCALSPGWAGAGAGKTFGLSVSWRPTHLFLL